MTFLGMHNERTVRKKINKAFRPVYYVREMWMWSIRQRSKTEAIEISNLRDICSMSRMDGESNKNVCERFGILCRGEGMGCGVLEVVKCNALR